MKIAAIISEYNPFHNGHLYQLNKTIEETKPDLKIAVMSGNFTQRGEMAILPKDIRAKVAIQSGFDVVIELPTCFAINNADLFSFGAVNTIKNFPNTVLSFGSELGSIEKLKEIVKITKTKEYNCKVKEYLKENSYPVSTLKAINYFTNIKFDGSNNILALEYLKKIEELNSKIIPFTIKRVDNYNSNDEIENFISASALRNLENKKLALQYMPEESYNEFIKFNKNDQRFHDFILSNLFSITKDELKNIYDVNEGLENRIKNAIENSNSYESFISNIETKRYSRSRINRILLNALLNINKETIKKENIDYISIIAIKKDKLDILGYLNKYTKIVTKYSDIKELNEYEKTLYEIDRKANNLYSLINNIEINDNMTII